MIGGLGVQELLIVFFIALILFGGKRLPEIGQNLGKALRGFKDSSEKAMEELHRENKAGTGPADEDDAPSSGDGSPAGGTEGKPPESPAESGATAEGGEETPEKDRAADKPKS